jgi:hypothetical protein
MAPALTESAPAVLPHALANQPVSKSIFPDGLKTSGQHNPIYSLIRPYEDFPREITGQTVWKAEDYRDHPERWTHVFSREEIAELEAAADAFIAAGTPLTAIAKELFPLPTLAAFFGTVRNEVVNGKGFILFKGIPVEEWGLHKSAVSHQEPIRHSVGRLIPRRWHIWDLARTLATLPVRTARGMFWDM